MLLLNGLVETKRIVLRSSDRWLRELRLYALSGAVRSAWVFGEWKLSVVSSPNVCAISIAISGPVMDGTGGFFPDAG